MDLQSVEHPSYINSACRNTDTKILSKQRYKHVFDVSKCYKCRLDFSYVVQLFIGHDNVEIIQSVWALWSFQIERKKTDLFLSHAHHSLKIIIVVVPTVYWSVYL